MDNNLFWICCNCNYSNTENDFHCNMCFETFWKCNTCTLMNNINVFECRVCKTPRSINRNLSHCDSIKNSYKSLNYSWICSTCTYQNQLSNNECEKCESQKRKSTYSQQNSYDIEYQSINDDFNNLNSLETGRQNKESKKIHIEAKEKKDEALIIYQNVVKFCKEYKQKFIDDQFQPSDKSLFSNQESKEKFISKYGNKYKWLDTNEIKTKGEDSIYNWTVFNGDLSFHDVKQGYLGNCWFLSALAVLCEKPELIKSILITQEYSKEGCYLVRLCHNGEWKIVIIDDTFPCDENGYLLYSKAPRKQLWVSIIEKALAKLNKTYEALISGYTIEGLSTLTGYPCERIHFNNDSDDNDDNDDNDSNWLKLLSSKEAGFAIAASCYHRKLNENDYEQLGLVNNHAYSILDVKQIDKFRLLQIRNPWGHRSWKGDWSNKSALWSTQRRIDFEILYNRDPISEDDNGTFWMCYDDFLKYFNTVDICKLHLDWMESRTSGFFPTHECHDIIAFELQIFDVTEIEFSLFRKSDEDRKNTIQSDLLLLVFRRKLPRLPFITSSKRLLTNAINHYHIFEEGEYIVLPLSFNFWYTSKRLSYNLSFHGSKTFIVGQENFSDHTLADSIISYALSSGKNEFDGQLFIVKTSNGLLIVASNSDENKYLHINIDASDSLNFVSTRNSLETRDSVPPRHCQVLIFLTQLEPSEGASLSYKYRTELKKEKFLKNRNTSNEPELNLNIIGLHLPRPIPN